MDLKNLQTRFVNALMTSPHPTDVGWIAAHPTLAVIDTLNIYRQSRLGKLYKILKATYPVCRALVGEHYFKQLNYVYAKEYGLAVDLNLYGGHFAQFLAEHPQHGLVYLPDVAQLEWSYDCLSLVQAVPALDPMRLEQVPKKDQPKLRFKLGTKIQLQSSPFPILRIWQMHQSQSIDASTVDLNEGGCQLLIYRCQDSIKLETLSQEAFFFLSCFKSGKTLAQTWECCVSQFPKIDFAALFAKAVTGGWLENFYF